MDFEIGGRLRTGVRHKRAQEMPDWFAGKEYFAVNVVNTSLAPISVSLFNVDTRNDPFYANPNNIYMDGGRSYLSLLNELLDNPYLIYYTKTFITQQTASPYPVPNQFDNIFLSAVSQVQTIDADGRELNDVFPQSNYIDPYMYQNILFSNRKEDPILLDGNTQINFNLPASVLVKVFNGGTFIGIFSVNPVLKVIFYFKRILRSSNKPVTLDGISAQYVNKIDENDISSHING